ncbi:alpha-mannosidase [Cohnella nanjingensis]|uniref:Glycoside hydrolase family 38 central domain-containing protein n=1 Tax=Cohnella nanjingensis TaxID=1387779 RepID=A0A7X0RNN2_9BACL|nr:glycoside hydrolase family 38 C-terminal domain-containing protein [Cohnella nanjingensis]MBB6670859.1 hypothetical protein [Cohnella nanjingensis]
MTTSGKKTVHFISHTHWDREWYLTFEQFRYRLVNLIDNVLDLVEQDASFRYFHLDGQTIVLDDYLQIRPERKERLFHWIREGRILVGPWYEQNDLFLTSAESTTRNLIEGIGTARELGGEMKVGYLPDHFGLAGQMPQIFREVGLDVSVFGRGYDAAKHGSSFIRWTAPDGSEVTGILMAHWYNNAQRLPNDEDELKIVFPNIQGREERIHNVPHYLMMNGVDHLEAQEDLTAVLDKLRRLYGDEYEFVHGRLDSYARAAIENLKNNADQPFPVVEGELREQFDYSILSGTLSARVYLKQANQEGHELLEKLLEPVSVFAASLDLDKYDTDYMRYMWKLYMQNHPHDSICGCSQDAVHDQMMERYANLKQIGGELLQRKLDIIAKQVSESDFRRGDQKLLVLNPSQTANREVIATSVYFLLEDGVESFRIEDEDGESVPYRIIRRAPSKYYVLSPINLPGVIDVNRFDIEWAPQAGPLGYTTYRIIAGEAFEPAADADDAAAGPVMLENTHLRIELRSNGSFDITDKATGVVRAGLGAFEECGDRGDLYVFTQQGEPQRFDGPIEVVDVAKNELYEAVTYRFVWDVPAGLKDDLSGRTDEMATCGFKATLRLDRNSTQVKLTVDIDNKAKYHRIRLLFPTVNPASHVWAGAQYDVVRRPWDIGRDYQRSAFAYPYWKWVASLEGDSSGLSVYAKGTVEYEALGNGETLALTLLRGTETINVREIVRMENDIQPKGQCLGSYRFELAIRPFAGVNATTLYQEAERFTSGLLTKQWPVDDDRWDRGRAWVQDTGITTTFRRPDPNAGKPALPRTGVLLKVAGDAMLSALKWAQDGSGPIIRLYNVETEASDVRVTYAAGGALGSVLQTNLLEEPKQPVAAEGSAFATRLGAKKIATFKLN